jgi:[ribosomal protein S5]-alanine N-acetyltransferase
LLETKRLRLRPLLAAEGAFLARVWGDDRVMTFCGGATAEQDLPRVLQGCLETQATFGFSPMAVLTREEAEPIGICGFKPLPDPAGVELIYHFVPERWGRGYATEAVQALLAWGREHLVKDFVEASFDARNVGSRKVLLKAGFTYLEDRWYEDVQRAEPVYRFLLRARS